MKLLFFIIQTFRIIPYMHFSARVTSFRDTNTNLVLRTMSDEFLPWNQRGTRRIVMCGRESRRSERDGQNGPLA